MEYLFSIFLCDLEGCKFKCLLGKSKLLSSFSYRKYVLFVDMWVSRFRDVRGIYGDEDVVEFLLC